MQTLLNIIAGLVILGLLIERWLCSRRHQRTLRSEVQNAKIKERIRTNDVVGRRFALFIKAMNEISVIEASVYGNQAAKHGELGDMSISGPSGVGSPLGYYHITGTTKGASYNYYLTGDGDMLTIGWHTGHGWVQADVDLTAEMTLVEAAKIREVFETKRKMTAERNRHPR